MSGCMRSDSLCVRITRWIPTLFILLIVGWSWYAYIIVLCFDVLRAYECATSEDDQRKIIADYAKELPVENRTLTGGYRYCERCHIIKPDRAHHDSVTGVCVLKMDHYCPWVNNCVGFNNYKYFILFLLYGFLYCAYVAATTVHYFVRFWSGLSKDFAKFHILFVFFVSFMFCIALIGLFAYHMWLTCSNKSTLESFRGPIFRLGPDKEAYNLGSRRNFQQVFGESGGMSRFLPLYTTPGDGCMWPTRTAPTSPYSYRSMEQDAETGFASRNGHTSQQPPSDNVSHYDNDVSDGAQQQQQPPPQQRPQQLGSDTSAGSQVSLLNETRVR